MKGWLLGSGGGIATPQRATCSALFRDGANALLVDAGTGVSHLLAEPRLLAGVETLDVVLTHFHLDHMVGLAYLPSLPLTMPSSIHGPGRSLYGVDTRTLLQRLLGPPFLARGWDLPAIATDISELVPGEIALGPFTIAARTQHRHSDPTLALRINNCIAYCTDTSYDPGNVALARGCHTLIHEAWYTNAAPSGAAHHSSASEAASIARASGVRSLIMIHINPSGDDQVLVDEARTVFHNSIVGTDLLRIA